MFNGRKEILKISREINETGNMQKKELTNAQFILQEDKVNKLLEIKMAKKKKKKGNHKKRPVQGERTNTIVWSGMACLKRGSQ